MNSTAISLYTMFDQSWSMFDMGSAGLNKIMGNVWLIPGNW